MKRILVCVMIVVISMSFIFGCMPGKTTGKSVSVKVAERIIIYPLRTV